MTERIDFTKSEQYTLSIRLSADGFSFSIYNPLTDNDFCFVPHPVNTGYSMTANLKDMLTKTEALKYPYKRVNILYDSPRFTPVPLELFPTARFFSTASPLTEYFARKSRLGNSRKLYTYIREQQMEVFCFDKGNLLLINSFPCKQTTDRVYYLLYVWQQLNYNQERDELHLTGILKDKEELLKELRNYLRQVFVISPKAEFNRSEISKIEEIPFDMQTLLLCE